MYLLEKTKRWAMEVLSKIWIVVSNSTYTKIVKFLRAGEKVQISNFIGWFCQKDKLLGQKTDITFYCPDTECLWKVSAPSEFWFLIQPFFWAGEKVKISNFIGLFCLKDKLVGQKADTASLLSWHWRAMKSSSKIWIVVSNSAYPKMVKFLRAGEKVKISNFIGWFCLTDKLLE